MILACRSAEKTAPVVEEIRKETGNDQVEFMALDLGSLQSVKEFASAFRAKGLPLHILLNNAAVMACPYSLTEDGLEMQFGTNHIGHFYLTLLLFDLLDQAQPARIVNVSSGGHYFASWENFQWDKVNDRASYSPILGYGRSKLANILFGRELNRRIAGRPVYANSIHPGAVMTDLGRHMEDWMPKFMVPTAYYVVSWFLATPQQGALNQLYVCTSPEIEEKDLRGLYFTPVGKVTSPSALGQSDALAEELWNFSVEIIKEKVPDFEIPEALKI